MKLYSLPCRWLAALLGLTLACSSCQSLQIRDSVKKSIEKNGVTLEESLPGTVSAGQPVEMVVKITNAGPKTVYFGDAGGIRELRIRLVDSKNAVPELTPRGKETVGLPEIYSAYGVRTLNPGTHYEWRVDLATLFKLQPGMYHVSVNLAMNPVHSWLVQFDLSTDPIEFTVR